MQIDYYNHKSFNIEPLIENYSIELNVKKAGPTDPKISRITADDLLNINLTYGCIDSIYKTLSTL